MFIAISKKEDSIGQLMAVGDSKGQVTRILIQMGLEPTDFNIIDPEVEGKRMMNEYYQENN
jgi:hypothetical protein